MGGPLATHAAIDLVYRGVQIKSLYTFGSYRVGETKFSIWFDNFMSKT